MSERPRQRPGLEEGDVSDFKDWTALDKALANAATRASNALLDIEQAHEAVILDYTRLRAKVAALEADKAALTTALSNLADRAEHDLKMNRDEEPGGWWSTGTAASIIDARATLAAHGTKQT